MVTTIPSWQGCAKLITDSADLHPPGNSLGGFCVIQLPQNLASRSNRVRIFSCVWCPS
jgi:hypothetical protein